MLESFDHKGVWWIPTNEEKKIGGILHYSPGFYPVLDLNGEFQDEGDFHKFILGFTSNGKKITLYKCIKSSGINSTPGYPIEKYDVALCLVGHHYNDENEIRFQRISMNYSGLEEWIGKKLFLHERKIENEVMTDIVKFEMPSEISVDIDNLILKINYGYTYAIGSYVESIQKITAWISLEFNDYLKMDDLWQYIRNIHDFLCLGIGKRINLSKLTAKADYITDYPNEVELIYPTYIFKNDSRLHPFFMVFNFAEITDNFNIHIQKWFDFVNIFKPTYELFFSSFENPHMHPINEFLSLVQALESYHGRKFTDNFVMPPTDYENLLKEIKGLISSKKIDKKFKKYLSDRTDYWNTKNLRRRLRELYSIHESIFNNFIDNKSYFISKIVDTRNYYTHYDLNLLDNIIDDKSLPMYSQKLKWMILVILLKELDFSDELVKNSFQKYQSYASIRAIY